MPQIHHDLHITSYGLIGLLFVGSEVVGLRTTILVALASIGLLIVLSLAASLVFCLRGKFARADTPRIGGADAARFR